MQRISPLSALFIGGFVLALLTQCSDNKVHLEGERLSLLEATNTLIKDPDADNMNIELPTARLVKNWAQMGGNGSHSMPHATFKGDFDIAWKESIGSGSDSTKFLLAGPVILNGHIYTIDTKGSVQARNAKTGALAWSFETAPKDKTLHHSGGGVAAAGDKLFVATPYGEVIALEITSGYEIWRNTLPYPVRSAPTVDGERVYVSTSSNHMIAYDAISGEKLWQHEGTIETTSFVGGAAAATARRVVLVPYSTGELFALRAENGHTLWNETLSSLRTLSTTSVLSQIRARPVIYKGMVIALSQGERMMALDFRTGQRIWDKEIGGVHTPAVTDSFIFVITNENDIVCLIRDTGKVAWVKGLPRYAKPEKKKGRYHWSGPTMAGGYLVLTGTNGQALFLDPSNGDIQKTLDLSGPTRLSPIAADEMLYFLTDKGQLVAVK